MSPEEKILLVQVILEDIRGNWATDTVERAEVAASLCNELIPHDERFKILKEDIEKYMESGAIDGDWDGRYFRSEFPYGYERMNELHGLNKTYLDKSDEFQRWASDFLTYLESIFEDWKLKRKENGY